MNDCSSIEWHLKISTLLDETNDCKTLLVGTAYHKARVNTQIFHNSLYDCRDTFSRPPNITRSLNAWTENGYALLLWVPLTISSSLSSSAAKTSSFCSAASRLSFGRFLSRASNSRWRTRLRSDGGVRSPVDALSLRKKFVQSTRFDSFVGGIAKAW